VIRAIVSSTKKVPAQTSSCFILLGVDENSTPASNTAELRIVNASPALGTVDVYIVSPGTNLSTVSPTISVLAFGAVSTYQSLTAKTAYRSRPSRVALVAIVTKFYPWVLQGSAVTLSQVIEMRQASALSCSANAG